MEGPDDADRLEAALDRIARAMTRRPAGATPAAADAVVIARLDALIADLRAALKE